LDKAVKEKMRGEKDMKKLTKRFVLLTFAVLLAAVVSCGTSYGELGHGTDSSAESVIIIDPAHGGRDPGAIGTRVIDGKKINIKESDVTLGIGMALKEKLLLAYPDIRVVLIREEDINILLRERRERINSLKLKTNEKAIYISIHNGYNFNANIRGYGLSVNNGNNNTESLRLANAISMGFSGVNEEMPFLGISRGDFPAPYMPGVMLEIGNMNNSEDILLLNDSQAFEKYAEAILEGITAYYVNEE
jgi:N-acetylmuramoyl-L-alanine amidase